MIIPSYLAAQKQKSIVLEMIDHPVSLPRLEVCPSPALLPFYRVEESVVVIIDVLRATSTIATAIYNGAAAVIPVDSVEKCITIGKKHNALTAGERDGRIASGLSYGNSPFEYPPEFIRGQTLVLTTTNGTYLLEKALAAPVIMTGSFPNLSAVCTYLAQQSRPVILACAGWRGRINIEDMLFAGMVISRVKKSFEIDNDSAFMAENLYLQHKDDMLQLIKKTSHYKRLERLGAMKDIEYCLSVDVAPSLPVLEGGRLVNKL